jgi:anti-sigma regulatory factor (Ser/Thr protein kinase)
MYAERGEIDFSLTPSEIRIIVQDQGRGIEDIELAMQEGYSTATAEMRAMGFGAGMGLPNIKKNSDRFEIQSQVSEGTTIIITVRTARYTDG